MDICPSVNYKDGFNPQINHQVQSNQLLKVFKVHFFCCTYAHECCPLLNPHIQNEFVVCVKLSAKCSIGQRERKKVNGSKPPFSNDMPIRSAKMVCKPSK